MSTELELLRKAIEATESSRYDPEELDEAYQIMEDTDWLHNYKYYWNRNYVVKTPEGNFFQVGFTAHGDGYELHEVDKLFHIVEVVPHTKTVVTYRAKPKEEVKQ